EGGGPREEPSEVERALLEALQNRPPPPPPAGLLLHGTLPPRFSSIAGKTATR
ncbi:hypothetical protein XENOCAPTIV_027950, partial [Xenoophorus captivus]